MRREAFMGRNRKILPVIGFCLLVILLAGCSRVSRSGTAPRNYTDAVELKLKFRELADQLLTTMPNYSLQGMVAMPVTFVDQNYTQRASVLGRLISEAMFYEFNQRGFPTREYRLTGNIEVRGARDNLVLVPDKKILATQGWAAILLGTYCVDHDATFVHARLVRAKDGLVMRTAELVLPNRPIILRLARSDMVYGEYGDLSYGLYGSNQDCGQIPIRQWR